MTDGPERQDAVSDQRRGAVPERGHRLVFGFFNPAPPTAIAVAAATLFGAGCTMFWESMRRFNGRPAALGRIALIVLAFAVVFGIALYSDTRLRDRLSLFSVAVAVLVALAAWEILRGVKQEVLLR